MSVLSSLVTNLVIPAVSTNVVSELKKRAIVDQAEVMADVFEDRVTDYVSSFRSKIRRRPYLCMGIDKADAQRIAAKYENQVRPEVAGKAGFGAVLSLGKFLVGYHDAETGNTTHKEIVCDLFESLSDIVTLMRSLNVNDDFIGYAEMGIQEVTKLVSEDKSKEAADMIFLGVKELMSHSLIMEVFK